MKRIFFAALCTAVVAALVTGQFEWDPAKFSASPGRVVGEWIGTVLPTFAGGSIVGLIVYWIRRRSSNPWKGALAAVITCLILEALVFKAG